MPQVMPFAGNDEAANRLAHVTLLLLQHITALL
jgi:hypothetical protein